MTIGLIFRKKEATRRPEVQHLIDRLESVNSDIVLLSTVSLGRLSPKGSYHLDGSGMSHTLAQKYLIELLMWNASNVQKTLQLNLTGMVE